VGCLYRTGNLILNCLHCYTSKFLQLAQIFWWSVAIQSRDLLAPRRQERQVRKLSFRPKGEIFLSSLGFPQDDGP
jgi:hypothetical protein